MCLFDDRQVKQADERGHDGSVAILGGPLSPVGWHVGFVEAPLEITVDRLLLWRRDLGSDLDVSDVPRWPDCLSMLDPLESPWTTELLVAHGGWTTYLNNGINGGDPWPATSYVAELLDVRWVVASYQPWTVEGHATTQLQLGGSGGEPPLRLVRTIAAHAEDGRWSWHSTGSPLSFEHTDAYGARRVRDRFSRALLVEYLAALGIVVDEPYRFGTGVRVRQRVSWSRRRQSIAQVRRSRGLS